MNFMPRTLDLFDDVFFKPMRRENMMKTDIYEKDGYYHLDIELPGYTKEDLSLEIYNGYVTIKAEHNITNEEKDEKGNLISSERQFGSSARSFYVGDNIKAQDIKASFNNGILELELPSQETKKIETSEKIMID